MKRQLITAVCAVCVGLAWAAPASADSIGGLYVLQITAQATNNDGSLLASHTWTIPHGIIDANTLAEFTVISSDAPYQLMNGATVLGTITDLEVGVQPDPLVKLKFAVTAGATDTPFTITSAVVPVPNYTSTMGYASAAVTVTDDGDGSASLTGQFPGQKAFEAVYNGSSVFSDLVDPVAVSVGSGTSSENWGWQPVPGIVSSISSQFQFVLSANDDASGTSTFQVIPEPGSLALAAIGVLALAGFGWRRAGDSRRRTVLPEPRASNGPMLPQEGSAEMNKRIRFLLLIAVMVLALPVATQASISVVDGPWPAGSVAVTLAAAPYVGFDKIEVQSGAGHLSSGETAAIFEPPAFRNLSPWADFGSDTAAEGIAVGPRRDIGIAPGLVFDLYLASAVGQPFAFDFYAIDSERGSGFVDFSAHVAYDGTSWAITQPASSPAQLTGPVPEPATLIVWSLLGAMSWLGMRVWPGGQRIARRSWSPENRQAILEIIDRSRSQ